MPDDLVFMMGNFAAAIPTDRLYTENHLWAREDQGRTRFGFTAYSVRLLNDVYFLSWSIDADATMKKKQELGEIESSKAVSTLYAPCAGQLLGFNEQLLQDPTPINTDPYGAGWLYEMQTSDTLLTPPEYVALLEAGWEKTQRMLKGQMNE